MRRPVLFIAAVLCATGVQASATAAPTAAAATCHGRAVTLTGTPGADLDGTDGPDVIVTNGAPDVDAGAGDDTVCVTGPVQFVLAGSGDDLVDATSVTAHGADFDGYFYLGAGDDTFDGGVGGDLVTDGDSDSTPGAPGIDQISTGAGHDRVWTGANGVTNDDVVDLGDGADELSVEGLTGHGSMSAGGGPAGTLTLDDRTRAVWRIDRQASTLASDTGTGPVVERLTGFDVVDVVDLTWSSLAVRGNDAAESLLTDTRSFTGSPSSTNGPVDARLGGGRDSLVLNAFLRGYFSGGPGRDALDVYDTGSVTWNLRTGSYLSDGERSPGRLTVKDVEIATVGARSLAMTSTDEDDRIRYAGCRATIDAGGGDDTVLVQSRSACRGSAGFGSTVHGGSGDDLLRGSLGTDRLIGGAGRDQAYGSSSLHDFCVAERRYSCEEGHR